MRRLQLGLLRLATICGRESGEGAASFAKIEQKVGPHYRRCAKTPVIRLCSTTPQRFDGADSVPDSIEVTSVDIDRAYSMVDEGIVRAFRKAADNIRRFHERQVQQTSVCILDDGTMMGQIIRPIERVGLYVPGGAAAYPSSVLMGAIPGARSRSFERDCLHSAWSWVARPTPMCLWQPTLPESTGCLRLGDARP